MICNKCKKDVFQTFEELCIECYNIPEDKVVDIVIDKYKKRMRLGYAKYQTNLMRQDLTTFDWIKHLQEELMDATLYLERLRMQINALDIKMEDDYDSMQNINVKPPKPGDRFIYGETWDDYHDKLSEQGYFEQSNNNDE